MANPPPTPQELSLQRRQKRQQAAKDTVAKLSIASPLMIADPANPNWQIKFQHIPSGQKVSFSGFVTSFSDDFSSTWNEETAYGRMDPLVTFQRTQRTISMAFDVVAKSLTDAIVRNNSVTMLQNFLYPQYNEGGSANSNTLKAAPLIKLKWANLVSAKDSAGLVGYIDGISYTPDFDSGFFLTAKGASLAPQLLRINFNFKVIHQDLMGWYQNTYGDTAGKTVTTLRFPPSARSFGPIPAGLLPGRGTLDPSGELGPSGLLGPGGRGSAVDVSNLEIHKNNLEIVKAQEQIILEAAGAIGTKARRDKRKEMQGWNAAERYAHYEDELTIK